MSHYRRFSRQEARAQIAENLPIDVIDSISYDAEVDLIERLIRFMCQDLSKRDLIHMKTVISDLIEQHESEHGDTDEF